MDCNGHLRYSGKAIRQSVVVALCIFPVLKGNKPIAIADDDLG